jgi:hypothetical protein
MSAEVDEVREDVEKRELIELMEEVDRWDFSIGRRCRSRVSVSSGSTAA